MPSLFNLVISIQTITEKVTDLSQLPNWDFDGSSTDQAPGHDSDVYLRPVAFYRDPFRGGDNILVLASTYNSDGTPNKTNFRHNAAKSMELAKEAIYYCGAGKIPYVLSIACHLIDCFFNLIIRRRKRHRS